MNPTTESSGKENIKISFITSNKGQSLLVLNNYLYQCNKTINKKNIGYALAKDVQFIFIQTQIMCIWVVMYLSIIMNQILN